MSAAADIGQVMAAADRPLPSTNRSRLFYVGSVAAAVVAVLVGIGVVGLVGDERAVQEPTNQRAEPTTTMTSSTLSTLSTADDDDADDADADTEPVATTQAEAADSTGPDQVVVPLLTGLDEANANATLASLNFTDVEARLEGSEVVPIGQVIRSEPAADQVASIDDTIIVFVSSGPARGQVQVQVQVPLVFGLSREAAESQLTTEDLQLVVQFQEQQLAPGDPDIGLVLNSSPGPDSVVLQGSTIIVVVGVEGRPETTTTTHSPDSTTTILDRTTPSTS